MKIAQNNESQILEVTLKYTIEVETQVKIGARPFWSLFTYSTLRFSFIIIFPSKAFITRDTRCYLFVLAHVDTF